MNNVILVLLLALAAVSASAAVYHVRPDGSDANSGCEDSPSGAWRSVDRGQPSRLAKATTKGDETIHLQRAWQLPQSGAILIGSGKVTYTGKDGNVLTGCSGTPDAKAGALVGSVEWRPPAAGDTVIVHAGDYRLPSEWRNLNAAAPVAVISSGGGKGSAPALFKGEGLPAIDGEHCGLSLMVTDTEGVAIEGFDIRRGGVYFERSKDVSIRDCRVHDGQKGVFVRYCENVLIERNKFYEFRGAWTGDPIALGSGKNYQIRNNTVALIGNTAISVFDKGGGDYVIERNLVTRCRGGIAAAAVGQVSSRQRPRQLPLECRQSHMAGAGRHWQARRGVLQRHGFHAGRHPRGSLRRQFRPRLAMVLGCRGRRPVRPERSADWRGKGRAVASRPRRNGGDRPCGQRRVRGRMVCVERQFLADVRAGAD